MRFDLDPLQVELVTAVDRVRARAGARADPRDVLALLGQEGLLAVHYPVEYGGRGLTLAHHAAVAERMGGLGLPDVAHLITVQAVGCALLAYGTSAQRERWLPAFSRGRSLASLLLSEATAGSDLAGITTNAVPAGDGWRITGNKTWSLYTDWSDVALCSVRTRGPDHRYDGISLFLVELSHPGVTLTRVARAAGPPYITVSLDAVPVDRDALVGQLHRGWFLLPSVIGFERTGFDYLTRAVTWLAAAETRVRELPVDQRRAIAPGLVRLRETVMNARAFAYHAVNTAGEGLFMDEIAVAYAKLACGRAAQAVARWAGQELLPLASDDDFRALLRAALAEAPEFTISGGAQELQLDLIAGETPIGASVR